MKKIVIMPDSFKGALSSIAVCEAIERGIKGILPNVDIQKVPISDGGEGCVDSFLTAFGGKKTNLITKGPYLEDVNSFYAMINPQTAVIEMAASAGLHLTKHNPNPSTTTTYGVGELIKDAALKGAKMIIIGLGGSATNDGGAGLAAALGIEFFNDKNERFLPVGKTLHKITKIVQGQSLSALNQTKIIALCDVTNPLLGKMGAAHIFSRQKGADEAMIEELESNMQYFANLLNKQFAFNIDFVSAGAAGGIPISLKCFFNASIQKGIDTILSMLPLEKIIRDADLIITGEGKFDEQSLQGKVIDGVSKLAYTYKTPCIALVGQIDGISKMNYPQGLDAVYSLQQPNQSLEEAMAKTAIHLERKIQEILIDHLNKQ